MDATEVEQHPGVRDSRTRLPNRDSFYHEMRPLLEDADSRGFPVVLLCVEVDGVDFALRTFGPFVRDKLIRQVGKRLRSVFEDDTAAYHITQSRFALVLPRVTHHQATRKARALVDAVHQPFDLEGVSYRLNACVGISHYPNHGDSINEWVRASVFASHQARTENGPYAIYDRQRDHQERERFRLMTDLERALDAHTQVQLAYQPIIELAGQRCVGVEGLCRWSHPTLGLIPPDRFLPFVEQTSLVLPLTETVLNEGLRELAGWRERGFEGHVAINLSPTLFQHPELLDRLLEHFRFSNMNLESVHFEVTETGIMAQPNRGAHILGEIRKRGSRVSIDDFGTGYSSLAYLADLPIDTIKIDKHFVQHLDQPWGEAVVGAACTLASKLGLKTVAEGVEDEASLEKARALGCDFAQGFYIARPMFRDELENWLTL